MRPREQPWLQQAVHEVGCSTSTGANIYTGLKLRDFAHLYGRVAAEDSFSESILRTSTAPGKTVPARALTRALMRARAPPPAGLHVGLDARLASASTATEPLMLHARGSVSRSPKSPTVTERVLRRAPCGPRPPARGSCCILRTSTAARAADNSFSECI